MRSPGHQKSPVATRSRPSCGNPCSYPHSHETGLISAPIHLATKSPWPLGRCIADLRANLRSLGVSLFGLLDRGVRDTTGPSVFLEALDELVLRAEEVSKQVAGL